MLRSKLMNLSAMLIFGTIAIFVRNIELTSKEIAALRLSLIHISEPTRPY